MITRASREGGWCARQGVTGYPVEAPISAMYLTSLAETKAARDDPASPISLEHKRRGFEVRPFSHPQASGAAWAPSAQNAIEALVIVDLGRMWIPESSCGARQSVETAADGTHCHRPG